MREEYLTLNVENFSVEVSSAVNPEARRPSQDDDSLDLYDYGSFIQALLNFEWVRPHVG
jgi:hypothetical protein